MVTHLYPMAIQTPMATQMAMMIMTAMVLTVAKALLLTETTLVTMVTVSIPPGLETTDTRRPMVRDGFRNPPQASLTPSSSINVRNTSMCRDATPMPQRHDES